MDTAGNEARKGDDRPRIRAFCASVWQDFFPDLPFTAAELKGALLSSTPAKILFLLTLAGLLLRLWHIGDVSFWLDEAVTDLYSRLSFPGIWDIATLDNNPPTFYWIEHVMLYFGSGETVLRLVPALLGTCTIPVFYLLGREFHNRTTGILAATLLTVSVFHISYSQEARPYTLLLFCFSLALLFCLHAIRTNSCSTWYLFGIFSALVCWSHFFGFVLVVPLFILAAASRCRSRETVVMDLRPVLVALAVWFLLSLPMLILTHAAGIRSAQGDPWGVRGLDLITSVLWNELGQSLRVVIFLFVLFLLGLVRLSLNNRPRFFFLLTAMTLPVVTAVFLSYSMPVAPRYLICLLPFFFLAISYFISSFHQRIGLVRVSCIAILVLVAFSVLPLANYYSLDAKNGQDWKGFSRELQNQAGAGDLILVFPHYDRTPLAFYYSNETEHTFISGVENVTDLKVPVMQDPQQEKFLLVAGSRTENLSTEIGQWTAAHAVLVRKDRELYLYRILPGP